MFPQLEAIKNIIYVVLFVGIVAGSYFKGRHDVQVQWDLQKEKNVVTVEKTKAESAQITTKVVTKYVDRIKTITVRGNEIVKYIQTGITKSEDSKYKLPDNFVSLYNDSVQNVVPDSASSSDANASTIKLSDALATIATNNTQCNAYRQQVISLQDWIRQQEILYNGKASVVYMPTIEDSKVTDLENLPKDAIVLQQNKSVYLSNLVAKK